MKTYINHPVHSTRMRVLSAFLAFLIFTLTFQEALVGWEFGTSVKATGDGNIHSTSTDKTSNTKTAGSSAGSGFTYTGKYTNNNKVTVFDYVTDYELKNGYNNCHQVESGYVDPFTRFNNAISHNSNTVSSAAENNITIEFQIQYSDASTPPSVDVQLSTTSNKFSGWLSMSYFSRSMNNGGTHNYVYRYTCNKDATWNNETMHATWTDKIEFRLNSNDNNCIKSNDGSNSYNIHSSEVGLKHIFINYANSFDASDKYFAQNEKGVADVIYSGNSTNYNNPLYFGAFVMDYNNTSNSDHYTSSNRPAYNNFYWQANMSLKDDQDAYNATYGQAVVQELVNPSLKGGSRGTLADPDNSDLALPYFDTTWAGNHSDVVKYYTKDSFDSGDITFPFYEVYSNDTSKTSVNLKTGSSFGTDEVARFYEFDSSNANLVFNTSNVNNHTGYFSESSTPITHGSNTGFFPFNTNNDYADKHNLGFGTKFEMDFQLEPDGCVSAVTYDNSTHQVSSTDTSTRVHTVFEFTGDDDLWVFIDGKLVLDMGGDHDKSHGIIDFNTGIAQVDQAVTFGGTSSGNTLNPSLTAYKQFNFRAGTTTQSIFAGWNSSTQKYDNTTHTMTIFYMERGMLDSNLLIRYNYSPISNASKMKIAEATKFTGVNAGLLSVTQKAAENDVFQYTVSNSGTSASDILDSGIKYPTATSYTRSNNGYTTTLTPNGSDTATASNYSGTNGPVANTSYEWVDKLATSSKMAGKTSNSGQLYLMYGTNDDLYGSSSNGYESSAEFQKQFATGSTMTIVQSETLYNLTRDNSGNATLFNSSNSNTGTLASGNTATRTLTDYYTSTRKLLDRESNDLTSTITNDDAFEFANYSNVSVGLAPQLTEYFINTVNVGAISVTKSIQDEVTKNDTFTFTLTLTDVFGVQNNNVSDYSGITITGATSGNTLSSGGTFTLQNGDIAVISGIPVGTKYTLVETPHTYYTTQSGQVTTAEAVFKGVLNANETDYSDPSHYTAYSSNHETIVNVRKTGTLTLTKNTVNTASRNNFDFEVTLNAPNGVNLANYSITEGGTALSPQPTSGNSFTVNVPVSGSTGTVTLGGIPYGTTYTVIEASDSKAGTTGVSGEVTTAQTIDGTDDSVTITNHFPKIVDVTAEKKSGSTGLPNAELDLYYKEKTIPPAYIFNDPFVTPTRQITVTIPTEPTAPAVAPVTVTATTQKKNYSYSYTTEETPSVTPTSWILPRSDNDYIYFRDYNSGNPALSDNVSFAHPGSGNTSAAQNAKRSWLRTDLKNNEQTQKLEIDYDHRYWFEAQFSGPNKADVKYSIWERFVDRYNSNGQEQDTVVWKIQPPDGYNEVRFCMYDGGHCIRTTEKIEFRLGEIYEKTDWGGIYKNEGVDCYFNVPLNDEQHQNWATHRTTAGAVDADKRMTNFNQSTMQQADRYTPTEQKVIFHCNSNQVWHNIHIEFFKLVGSDYQTVGQQFPGYMMEPYAYAGDNYRIGNYLTYELTIPDGATHFRVNNGVDSDPYNYRSGYTKLHDATDKNGKKNYANYFKIQGAAGTTAGFNVTSGTPVTLDDWSDYPSADERNKTYSTNAVDSDYDYIYFEAPSSWGNHIYAYFYGGGDLRGDNWQRAVYSIWPGITPVGTVFTAGASSGSSGHSDIYGYPLSGSIANPDNTFADKNNNTTVYKFKIPLGERKNYSKVIFNNGLQSQVSLTSPADGKTHETGVIDYNRGYLYKANGSAYQHYENNPTIQYEQRGDKLYIKTGESSRDDIHIKFYNASGTQILQGGSGYLMQYSGVKDGNTYYTIPIPKDAKKFSLNNGKSDYSSNTGTKNVLSTGIYDIPRYDSSLNTSNVITADVTAGNVVYKLTNTSLEQTSPKITMKETVDTTVTTGTFTPENPSPRGDYLYIRDAGNILNDTPTITFYEFADSSTAISTTLAAVKLNDEPAGTDWYSIGIPVNASYFTMTYNSTTTDKTQIYAKSSGANQLNATPGDMYYDTTADGLEITWPTFTSDADDLTDEHYTATSPSYGQRGDNLYVVSSSALSDPKVIFYNSSGVPIVNAAGNSEISLKSLGQITAPASGAAPVDGKTSNDANAQGYWYRAAIPIGAATFAVKYGSTTTEQEKIYEKSDKIKRYSNDYTLDGMQYRINGTSATLLYPIFEEDPNYTLDAGGGQVINSNGSTVRVDTTQVADYANYGAATAEKVTNDPTPALYQTTTNDVTYSSGSEYYDYIRFDVGTLGWTDVRAHMYNSDSDGLGWSSDSEKMTKVGGTTSTVYKFAVPTNANGNDHYYQYVIFHEGTSINDSYKTITIDLNQCGSHGRGYLFVYDNDNGNGSLQGVNISEPSGASITKTGGGTTLVSEDCIYFYHPHDTLNNNGNWEFQGKTKAHVSNGSNGMDISVASGSEATREAGKLYRVSDNVQLSTLCNAQLWAFNLESYNVKYVYFIDSEHDYIRTVELNDTTNGLKGHAFLVGNVGNYSNSLKECGTNKDAVPLQDLGEVQVGTTTSISYTYNNCTDVSSGNTLSYQPEDP